MNTLEVCCGSLDSVIAAVEGGAERIELCSALSLDGLTPSIGLVREVRSLYPDLKIHVLIRPREGDFVYSEAEVRVMERDIRAAINAGATAIVSGALLPVGAVGFSSNDFTLDISRAVLNRLSSRSLVGMHSSSWPNEQQTCLACRERIEG